MMNWRETCAHMEKLIAINAPPMLKAHCLVRLVLPKLIAQIGVTEVSSELARLLADGLCAQTGTCSLCRKAPSDGGDGNDGMCCKCRAEIDQFAAEAGL